MNAIKADGQIYDEANPDSVTGADIVVGILSNNDGDAITLSLEKATGGLRKFYPNLKGVLVNSDCHSGDKAKELFLGTDHGVPKIYVSTPPDCTLKRTSFFNLMEVAHRLQPRVVLTLEARISTIKTSWIPRLASPILNNGASYTAPIYSRQFFDTPVTFLLTYPMFRAIFGRRIRHPNMGDAAFSGALNEILLEKTVWPTEDTYAACELTMQAVAVSHGPVFQSFMGDPRVGHVRRPIDVGTAEEFYSNLKTFYELMEIYPKNWLKVKNSRPTPILGADLKPEILAPRVMSITPETASTIIQNIARDSRELWDRHFTEFLPVLGKLGPDSLNKLEIDPEFWVRIIYKGALVFRQLEEPARDAMVRSLIPLFLLRLFNFYKLTCSLNSGQLMSITEDEALLFEKFKPDLTFAWKSMDHKV
ncbi:MAG: hypothetical protein LBF40_10320 [Deltaproteobacteria bacterium]|jgi:hypothetical protein|nr:hypothetical protein [Deltaproteobacteria bacterium]